MLRLFYLNLEWILLAVLENIVYLFIVRILGKYLQLVAASREIPTIAYYRISEWIINSTAPLSIECLISFYIF